MHRHSWFSRPKPPKNVHSLEHLKYLHYLLTKNQTITESNKSLIVEAFRSMSEILIWGDQNDSSVFEFFLEKNMFTFFLNILQQNAGNYVCVQLLQTLNIVFENLHNETSLYYMLSNNHVNEVICHKFDFSDEEVMAYYISFLKTLSLRLNEHTIHFFYNEHTDDFALYTEAIKFFNHSESMVRIAVRTLTLNVYKVNDEAMLRFIRDKTGAPYFSNLTWFIAQHVRYIDSCVRSDVNHQQRGRLRDLIAEHLDYMHYINDILTLENKMLNEMLIDHLLHRLFLPLYIHSLTEGIPGDSDENNLISSVVGLFLLSQVFLILHNDILINKLADIILNNNLDSIKMSNHQLKSNGIMEQPESLETLLSSVKMKSKTKVKSVKRPNYRNIGSDEDDEDRILRSEKSEKSPDQSTSRSFDKETSDKDSCNDTDAETGSDAEKRCSRPFLDNIFSALNCTDNDYNALFALCLIYAMLHNRGIDSNLKNILEFDTNKCEETESETSYSLWLKERLLRIISKSVKTEGKIRLATLQLSAILLKRLGISNNHCILLQTHLNSLQQSHNISKSNLHSYVKEEEILLDIFEDEYRTSSQKNFNVEYLMMDSSLLLYPTGTPLTGIDFIKRLPCGESEQARRAVGVFLIIRKLWMTSQNEVETQLPLTRDQDCIHDNEKLDLNNSDLIACTVVSRDQRHRRFLVVDLYQIILVEPDSKRLGWGVVKFAGYLQDVEVSNHPDDSRSLKVTIHRTSGQRRVPLLLATLIFDDHIRCMAAKQRLTKGRLRARNLKLQRIASLIGLPESSIDDPFASSYLLNSSATPHKPQQQFRVFNSSLTSSGSDRFQSDSKHAPSTPTARVYPLLKRPGHAASRIGNLGLPTTASKTRQQSKEKDVAKDDVITGDVISS